MDNSDFENIIYFYGGATMNVELKGNKLVITMDYNKAGIVSSTGKTLLHATGSQKFSLDGQVATVGVNVYTKNPVASKAKK